MSRVQLALNVSDLDAAIAFYSKLFATEPAKVRPGLRQLRHRRAAAQARADRGRRRAGLAQPPRRRGRVDRRGRRGAAPASPATASPTATEDEVACCYAVQDKVWVDGPDGEPWEIYTVLADVEMPPGELRTVAPDADAAVLRDGAGVRGRAAADASMRSRPRAPGDAPSASAPALLVAIVVGSGIAAQRLSPGRHRPAAARELDRDRRRPRRADPRASARSPARTSTRSSRSPTASLGGITTTATRASTSSPRSSGAASARWSPTSCSTSPRSTSRRTRARRGGLWLGEVVATFGLLLVILGVVRSGRASVAPFAVGGYIAAAYWFTSSTSFANPAVTIGRTLSDTFAGIRPSSVPVFVVVQIVGGAVRGRARAVPAPRSRRPSTSSCPTSIPSPPERKKNWIRQP